MRKAKLADLKKALEKRGRDEAPHLTSLKITELPGFAELNLAPEIAFAAICGGTGTGKTALLDLLHAGIAPQIKGLAFPRLARLGDAKIEIGISHGDGEYRRIWKINEVAAQDDDGFPNGVQKVGLADRTSTLMDYFSGKDITALKDGVEPYQLTGPVLESISHACRKEYKKITIYEIEGEAGTFMPFFDVVADGAAYDTTSMATGELSAIYLARVCHLANPHSILLVEEPEAYLPPASHSAVFGIVCHGAVKKHLLPIITTHSAEIVTEVPERHLLSIRSRGGISTLPTSPQSKARVLSSLGLQATRSGIIVVEDEIARIITDELVHAYELHMVCNVEILVTKKTKGGAGGVKAAVEGMPPNISSFGLIGLLDGDMREQAKTWECADKLLFLPFASAIEAELLAEAQAQPARFANETHRPADRVQDALKKTAGMNHHDRFHAIAAELGRSVEELATAALRCWVSKRGNKTKITKLAKRFAKQFGVTLP